ncbi:MAG: DNA recombination protein RmuC [Deltaproteobacteria bacterium]|nr:DNA recombination protein RmuC [Deltaproteobacteria bacterium]MCW8893030.1 DNA recombination protein RmuC [Deltaproteobacteria bacterium]MCW9050242.1 DNA recombination protein RmuC [Deltaproteobacteria bacterium]
MPLIQNIWILLSAALVLGFSCGWLISRLQAGQQQQRQSGKEQREREELLQQLARVEAQIEAERRSNVEKLQLLDENRQQLEKNFQALSAQALTANNQSFLALAKSTLETFQTQAQGDLDSRQQAIGQLVQPLKESLQKVDGKIEQLEQARTGAYARLDEQLKGLLSSQLKLESETGNLVRALRTPAVRGRWGEIQLRKVVEMAGMVSYCDFVEQETADGGRLRPDMIIKLPNGRNIVVDSKAPLQGYLESLEATDDNQRKSCLIHHARQIRDHLQKLSAKNYWEQFQPTPEFVVLFLPGETFFSAALAQDPSLIEAGVDQKVLLATPTTLIALLRSVAYGWRQEQLTENAEAISQLGRDMYDRLATLNQYFVQMGKNLERAVDSYNKGMSSFDSRVMVSARKFKELGAGSSKDIAPAEQIDKLPRSPQIIDS